MFYTIAVLSPFLFLLALEGVLRLTWKGVVPPLFVTAPVESGDDLMANRDVSRRWFLTEEQPPVPIADVFARVKPAHSFRVFAMGESTTAGFPFPHNGAFPRLLGDVLRDVLPSDTVEVVNLGIPATNSFSMLDMADEVIAQHPDAVIIYAGHNEYYGALGGASSQSILGGSPAVVRLYLRLQRIRVVAAVRSVAVWTRRKFAGRGAATNSASGAASFMETLAGDQQIALNGPAYHRGTKQFDENLSLLVEKFHDAHVPVFVGSLTSNVKDRPPLVSTANEGVGGADSSYAAAQRALTAGDSARARQLFVQARDLDVVRFRAPSEFNTIVKSVAKSQGAVYVPVAESFDSASGGMPGSALFLEHVHPTQDGAVLLARTYFDALRAANFLGHPARLDRMKSWAQYEQGMDLTSFDARIVHHTRETLLERWPFVPVLQQRDYRETYHPVGLLDSLAFLASRGSAWGPLKLQLAQAYASAGRADSAAAELRGVVRDAPGFAEPLELLGVALMQEKADSEAFSVLQRALAIRPSASVAFTAGDLAMRQKNPAAAIPLFELAVRLGVQRPEALYELSLAYALTHDVEHARAAALQLARTTPAYPGLADWMRTLGMVR